MRHRFRVCKLCFELLSSDSFHSSAFCCANSLVVGFLEYAAPFRSQHSRFQSLAVEIQESSRFSLSTCFFSEFVSLSRNVIYGSWGCCLILTKHCLCFPASGTARRARIAKCLTSVILPQQLAPVELSWETSLPHHSPKQVSLRQQRLFSCLNLCQSPPCGFPHGVLQDLYDKASHRGSCPRATMKGKSLNISNVSSFPSFPPNKRPRIMRTGEKQILFLKIYWARTFGRRGGEDPPWR